MAKARSNVFAESVNIVRADDTELRQTLKQDEQLVKQSVGKMQGDLDTMQVSMTETGDTAMVATSGVSALGAAAAVTGSQTLMVSSQLGTFVIMAKQLGDVTLGATAQLKAWGIAAAKFMISPAGLAIAAVVALGTALAVTFSETARNKIAGFGLGLKDLEARNKTLEERLKAQNDAYKLRVRLLEDQMILEQTGVNRALERLRPREQELTIELRRVKVLKVAQAAEEARHDALIGRVMALNRETSILEGQKTTYDFITNAMERQARIARDKALSDKSSAEAAEMERRARTAMIAAEGPRTEQQARRQIGRAVELVEANQRGMFQMRSTLLRMHEQGTLSIDLLRLLDTRLGAGLFGQAGDPSRIRSGAIEAVAFAGGRIPAGGVSVGPPELEQKKQTELLKDVVAEVKLLRGDVKESGGAQ